MLGPLDVALALLFAVVWPIAETFVLWPRHMRAVDAGDSRARSRVYLQTLSVEWLVAAAVAAVMLYSGRSLDALGLRVPHGWRLWTGAALPTAYAVLVSLQGRALAAKPTALAKLRERLKPLRGLIPHTPGEYRLFNPLAVTAGICEELLYRGYLVWVLQHWLPLWVAAGASMVLFGFAHVYQGAKYGLRAFGGGVVMGVLALVTRSLLPGMVLHALIDLAGGWITYMAMRAPETSVAAEAAKA
jgi:membrane protease YdiL (CAAX protease family)